MLRRRLRRRQKVQTVVRYERLQDSAHVHIDQTADDAFQLTRSLTGDTLVLPPGDFELTIDEDDGRCIITGVLADTSEPAVCEHHGLFKTSVPLEAQTGHLKQSVGLLTQKRFILFLFGFIVSSHSCRTKLVDQGSSSRDHFVFHHQEEGPIDSFFCPLSIGPAFGKLEPTLKPL